MVQAQILRKIMAVFIEKSIPMKVIVQGLKSGFLSGERGLTFHCSQHSAHKQDA